MKREDFLVEILTEELPPKALLKLAQAFQQQIKDRLEKTGLEFSGIKFFATPRRLAVLVNALAEMQEDQVVERKGPALSAAFDAQGKPTQPCIGFAKSCGVAVEELMTIKTEQGEWVGFKQHVKGKSVKEILPELIEQAALALPIPKRMRWGDNKTEFVRPIHAVMMLYGKDIIEAPILGCEADRKTLGHRFHAPEWLSIESASSYEKQLEDEGHVIADFAKRREKIRETTLVLIKEKLGNDFSSFINKPNYPLLDEVTALVELPEPLLGSFDKAFLSVPDVVLKSSMEDHQRYFAIFNEKTGEFSPHFVTISNIDSKEPARVIHGNERVLRARLSDAAFFFATDKKEKLENRLAILKGIVYQAKLGSLYDKAKRLAKLSAFIADKIGANIKEAERAGWLAKTDLTTNMVSEFPELQGLMGRYYAEHDGESESIAIAMDEQYMPRFAGDELPENPVGRALALADKMDALTGSFCINQIPTGDKDPFGLRRAAIGIIRISIEDGVNLDLKAMFEFAQSLYTVKLENKDAVTQLLLFMQERMRSWYQDQGISPDVLAAVFALRVTNPLDISKRVQAVQAFKKLSEAEALSVANKRVSNILEKQTLEQNAINPALFEHDAERTLFDKLEQKQKSIQASCENGEYENVLKQLADLRQPVDDFFDHVMVMTEDKPRRENRIVLLSKLRKLFLQVADIALLQ